MRDAACENEKWGRKAFIHLKPCRAQGLSWLLDTSSGCVGDPACLLQPTDQSLLLHSLPFAATFFLPPRPTGQPLSFGWRCHSLGQRPSTIELYTSPDGTAYHLHAIINAAAAEPDGVLHRVSTPPLAPTSIFFRVVVLLDGPTRDARDARRATAVLLSELALVSDDADRATSVSTPPAPPPPHADSYPLPSALPTFQLPPLPPPQPQPPPPHPPPRPAPVLSAPWPPLLPARTLPSPWGGGIECRLQLVQHTVHTATLLAALQRQVRARPIGASWRPGPRDRHAHHTHTQAQRTHTRAHPPTHLSPTYARWRARKRERGERTGRERVGEETGRASTHPERVVAGGTASGAARRCTGAVRGCGAAARGGALAGSVRAQRRLARRGGRAAHPTAGALRPSAPLGRRTAASPHSRYVALGRTVTYGLWAMPLTLPLGRCPSQLDDMLRQLQQLQQRHQGSASLPGVDAQGSGAGRAQPSQPSAACTASTLPTSGAARAADKAGVTSVTSVAALQEALQERMACRTRLLRVKASLTT